MKRFKHCCMRHHSCGNGRCFYFQLASRWVHTTNITICFRRHDTKRIVCTIRSMLHTCFAYEIVAKKLLSEMFEKQGTVKTHYKLDVQHVDWPLFLYTSVIMLLPPTMRAHTHRNALTPYLHWQSWRQKQMLLHSDTVVAQEDAVKLFFLFNLASATRRACIGYGDVN